MTMKPTIVHSSPAIASHVSGRSCHSGRVPASLRCSLIRTPHAHRKNAIVGAMTRTRSSKSMGMKSLWPDSRIVGCRISVDGREGMDLELKGRIAVVTAASGGLGQAIAEAFAAQGAIADIAALVRGTVAAHGRLAGLVGKPIGH